MNCSRNMPCKMRCISQGSGVVLELCVLELYVGGIRDPLSLLLVAWICACCIVLANIALHLSLINLPFMMYGAEIVQKPTYSSSKPKRFDWDKIEAQVKKEVSNIYWFCTRVLCSCFTKDVENWSVRYNWWISGERREARWGCSFEQIFPRNLSRCWWRHKKSHEKIFCKAFEHTIIVYEVLRNHSRVMEQAA